MKLTAPQKRKLTAYVAARRAADAAQSDAEDLKQDVMNIVRASGGALAHDGASIKLGTHRSYVYSAEVKEAEKALADQRKAEVADGTAEVKEADKLIFADAKGATVE